MADKQRKEGAREEMKGKCAASPRVQMKTNRPAHTGY